MKIPVRPAPSIQEAQNKKQGLFLPQQNKKRKIPPPRPPPPNFGNKVKSQSAWNLNQVDSLLEWSPPGSPKTNDFPKFSNRPMGGSVSSSFSSSTSSLASSKKSFEYETVQFNISPWANANQTNQFGTHQLNSISPISTANPSPNSIRSSASSSQGSPVVPQISVPTIIRPQAPKPSYTSLQKNLPAPSNSPPMPSVPPPSPPKETKFIATPVGVALYDFPGNCPGDLPLQVNDVVFLIRRVNSEWLYGRVDDKEGIFPANFLDIQVPLPGEERIVTVLYEFQPQAPGDLHIKPGQLINILKKVSDEWLHGECNGKRGDFPANFVDRIPLDL